MTAVSLALLDRDGVLNRKAPEGAYVTDPRDLRLLPGAGRAVARLNRARIAVAVVTNQRAIALGLLTDHGLDRIHRALAGRLLLYGARVDAIYHCPHDATGCRCRKPAPGLLGAALHDFASAPEAAVMIGDAATDVEAGQRAGTRTIQITDAPRWSRADATALDLEAAVDLVLGRA